MLPSRIYKPKGNELIYHYCSAETFHLICTLKKIRLSDIFSMNDYLEMRWGFSIWDKVREDLKKEIDEQFLNLMNSLLRFSSIQGSLISSSFSLNGDSLSQWRAYADDGKGFVIGFRAKDIIQLPVRPLKVEYNVKKQTHELNSIVKAIFEVEKDNPDKYGDNFRRTCYALSYDLASFKNPAFSEEKEVRIVHILKFEPSNDRLKLIDTGGTSFGKDNSGEEVKFFMSQNSPRSYIDFDFTNASKVNPIKEVLIGPKNNSLDSVISLYLETVNIGKVKVKKSKASYR